MITALFFVHENMTYDKEIYQVLAEAGHHGISVQKISKHVYNAHNTLFTPIDFADVHNYVTQFLLRNSKDSNSIIEKTSTRGIYRLNFELRETQQLVLQFTELHDADESLDQEEDLSLPLLFE